MRERRDFLWTVLCGFLNGIVAAAAVYAAALLLLSICGVKPYIVLSGSMEPEIRTGSLCFINTKAKFETAVSGDVIAFETGGGMLVTHRAVSISEGRIETKGDANDVSDGFTTNVKNYRGKVLFSIPYLGYGNYFFGKPGGKILCIATIFLNLAIRMSEKSSNKDDFFRKK